MKKVVLALAVLVGVSTANFSIAGNNNDGNFNVEVSSLDNLQFRLVLDELDSKSTVFIRDYSGAIIYSLNIPKTEKFSKVFDLSNLRDGSYVFQVQHGKQKVEKQFEINTQVKRVATPILN